MKRWVAIALLVCVLLLLVRRNAALHSETVRLQGNVESLAMQVDTLRRINGRSVAETGVLRLRAAEYERLHRQQAETIRTLGIRLREAERVAQTAVCSDIRFSAPLDTLPSAVGDSVVSFAWRDAWTRVDGRIGSGGVECRVESRDTLVQVLQRIPRRFLFIRWGTKAVRQKSLSTNPHTTIVYSEYVELERRRKR